MAVQDFLSSPEPAVLAFPVWLYSHKGISQSAKVAWLAIRAHQGKGTPIAKMADEIGAPRKTFTGWIAELLGAGLLLTNPRTDMRATHSYRVIEPDGEKRPSAIKEPDGEIDTSSLNLMAKLTHQVRAQSISQPISQESLSYGEREEIQILLPTEDAPVAKEKTEAQKNTPFSLVELAMETAATVMDTPQPTTQEIMRNVGKGCNGPALLLARELGSEQAGRLFAYAAQTWRGQTTWNAVYAQRGVLIVRMRQAAPKKQETPQEIVDRLRRQRAERRQHSGV